METTVILPCGTIATVGEFTGVAQRHIHSVIEAVEAERPPPFDWENKVLGEVVRALGDRGKRPQERDLLDLAVGSRLRLLVEARRLTYGDDLEMEWVCPAPGCRVKNTRTMSLAELVDVPYPEPAQVCFRASNGAVFTLGWGTGRTDLAFARARASKSASILDEPLYRIVAVDGEAKGPRVIEAMSAKILDEVRRAGRAMSPVYDADGAANPQAPDVSEVVAEPAAMPRAGCPERVRVACESCGVKSAVGLATQPDFLLRGVAAPEE